MGLTHGLHICSPNKAHDEVHVQTIWTKTKPINISSSRPIVRCKKKMPNFLFSPTNS